MREEGPFLTFDCQVSKTLDSSSTAKLTNLIQVIAVGGEGADIGGEEGEALDDGKQQKINLVHSFGLQPTTFDKKAYMLYLKVRLIVF